MGRGTMVVDAPVSVTPEVTEGPTDGVLVAAVRRGDDRAFEQLYSRYQRRISAYIFGMVKDHGRAEDITQEVFISALRRMRETDRAIAFKPWIYEIAKNACIDQFRRSRRAEEISMDAGEGLGQADHGRLVAGDPTPDDAVDAKQQLDHLCGAFGGLSDSHHEILVLREFEGLSYREIGDRMGLSRPGVESTLFRARKRLTEEYDELVSGQRCQRIHSIITAATGAALGARDKRRLARHISHCQPCRRMAVASGLDTAAMARRPVRRAIERAAAFLPLPGFLRTRFFSGAEQIVPVSEPMAAAWSKAVAVGAALVVAGVGTGVVPNPAGGERPALKPDKAKTAAKKDAAAPASSSKPHPATGCRSPAARHREVDEPHERAEPQVARHVPARAAEQHHRPHRQRPGDQPPTKPAATNPTREDAEPVARRPDPHGGGGTTTPTLPQVQLPSLDTGVGPTEVGSTVDQTVQNVTQTVTDTTDTVQDTVDDVTGGLLTP